jgi:ABC-type glycerol-3-phosphate transport system substrate-binding protein
MGINSRLVHRLAATAALILVGATVAPMPTHATLAQAKPTVTVWTDAVRLPGFQMYAKTHPNVNVVIKSYLGNNLMTNVALWNRAGSGWPDVVFDQNPQEVASLSDTQLHFTADLTNLVPKTTLSNFAQVPLQQCTFGGKLYCLRNDIAPNVLWYNAKLMKQFGYAVPTTWEAYQAIGLKVAKDHPGYIIGSFGDKFGMWAYLWPAGCPLNQVTGVDTVRINTSLPVCTKMAQLLDPLVANGSMSKLQPFDPAFTKIGKADKILMFVGAAWFTGMFEAPANYGTPKGEMAAAAPLKWAADSTAVTGAEGGGAYFLSSHVQSANQAAAIDLITWMATNSMWQDAAATIQPGLPAYVPDEARWLAAVAKDPYWASNPVPAILTAAKEIGPAYGYVRFDTETAFQNAVITAIKSGKTIESAFPTLQSQLTQLAKIDNYTVVQ